MQEDYFVYYHIRLDNNSVFYVGKGTKLKSKNIYNRAYSDHNRTALWFNIINKTPYKVEIIKDFSDELEALKYETRLIELFGLYIEGGQLVNFHKNTYERFLKRLIPKNKKPKAHVKKIERKVVYQYSLIGEFIQKWSKLVEAAKGVNGLPSDIAKAAKGITSTCKGYQWRYEKFDKIEPVEVHQRKNNVLKKVYQFDMDCNLVASYNSIKEASLINNISLSNIYSSIHKVNKPYINYYWSRSTTLSKKDVEKIAKKNLKSYYIYNKNKQFIILLYGCYQASNYLDIPYRQLGSYCKGNKIHKEYIISYEKLH